MKTLPRLTSCRRAATLPLVAVSTVMLVGMAALAIDSARLYTARNELQVAADAAALAGAGALTDESRLKGTAYLDAVLSAARGEVADYAERNEVLGEGPTVSLNAGNAAGGDLVLGYLADPTDRVTPLDLSQPSQFNSVHIEVRRDAALNGSIALTFARIFGLSSVDMAGRATAMVPDRVSGYRVNENTENADLLPFALKITYWTTLLATGANGSNDNYTYNPATGTVSSGPDGVPELNLYPGSGGGQLPPGNFGTVDIGSDNNSTADISRQIRYGVNAEDLSYFGGELTLGPDGALTLNGDTGLSAAVKDDLESIKGQPRDSAVHVRVRQRQQLALRRGWFRRRPHHVRETDRLDVEQEGDCPAGLGDRRDGDRGRRAKQLSRVPPADVVSLTCQ
jgi:hypothetical protein